MTTPLKKALTTIHDKVDALVEDVEALVAHEHVVGTPASAEVASAITKLREANMHLEQAQAQHEQLHPELHQEHHTTHEA